MKNKLILAISGNDIYSGGGLYADLTTYTVNGFHGFVAVTCLTAMTEQGFEVFPTETSVFAQQLASLEKVPFSAIKIGLLPNVEIAELALDFIKRHADIPVVLDPVLVCKESHDVEVTALRTELIKFFSYASIITPNLVEAQLLTQGKIESQQAMEQASKSLLALGARAVVIKGGNRLRQNVALDLFCDGKTKLWLENPVLVTSNVGAGCTFASSIAASLASGEPLKEAVSTAKDFVYGAIARSDDYGVIQYDR